MIVKKTTSSNLDLATQSSYSWSITDKNNNKYDWKGFYTGPLVLEETKVDRLCQKLLAIPRSSLLDVASKELRPVPSLNSVGTSIILHSTTPSLKTFDGDFDKIKKGITPSDYTSYKEGRAVYLAQKGDLAVGRIQPWQTAVKLFELSSIDLQNTSYYYLSHALLALAEKHLETPNPAITKLIQFIQNTDQPVIRLYSLEEEMQIFLVWLKRMAGLDYLLMDANSPEVARDWNRKSILFPTVELAEKLNDTIQNCTPYQILAEESKYALLRQQLNCHFPVLPGYTICRTQKSLAEFIQQTHSAAKMLQKRYGLSKGCLKASDSGDGARITPNIKLDNIERLTDLATNAYQYGDDYILEPHITYSQIKYNNELLKTSPSAHIRWGEVAPGLTLQFTEGTSWKGNLYLDEQTAKDFNITEEHYQIVRKTMNHLLAAFKANNLGLTIAGLDFAIGQIGGFFGNDILIGVQDPNISFNGAECLRVFLEKAYQTSPQSSTTKLYGATRVFKPSQTCTLPVLHDLAKIISQISNCHIEAIAAIPQRWGMIAAAHEDTKVVMEAIQYMSDTLNQKGLME